MLKNSKRLCVFAHFNPQLRVAEYVFYYLQRLHDDVNADIIFSSTSAISAEDRARLEALCIYIIVRKNEGYDFGSWQEGIHALSYEQLSKYDEIIIANDSCYGPLVPFTEMWDEMDKRVCDFWGITDCIIYSRYIESYFIVFRRTAFRSQAFVRFWENIPVLKYKHDVVTQCEQRLTRMLVADGLRYSVYISYNYLQRFWFGCKYKWRVVVSIFYPKNRQFIINKLQPVNAEETGRKMRILYGVRKLTRLLAPFHSNIQLLVPVRLICKGKTVPVIKKMLIKQNPLCINLLEVKRAVGERTNYSVDYFE